MREVFRRRSAAKARLKPFFVYVQSYAFMREVFRRRSAAKARLKP